FKTNVISVTPGGGLGFARTISSILPDPEFGTLGAAACDGLNGTRHHRSSENRTSLHSLDTDKSAPAPRPEVFRIPLRSLSFLDTHAKAQSVDKSSLH